MRITMIAAALTLMVFNHNARADFFTGNDLYNSCRSNNSFVHGYVAGMVDKTERDGGVLLDFTPANPKDIDRGYSELFGAAMKGIGWICFPVNMNIQQATDVFCKFLHDNPQERNKPATILFLQAMEKAFPATVKTCGPQGR
jgi:Rap1a immunity proteins